MSNEQTQLETLATMNRMMLTSLLGLSHNGERNLYTSLGYPETIRFEDYASRYARQDIANGIISRPAAATWAGNLQVIETNDAEETTFEKAWAALWENPALGLKSKFARLDRLTSIGTYGILLLGYNDVIQPQDFEKEVKKGVKMRLLYVKPFSQKNAVISTYDEFPTSPRYGLPQTYSIQQRNTTLTVHYSRVLHVAWDKLEDEVEGTPVLEAVYNRLMDLEKVVGGSAEMFWRGARPGINAEVDKDFQLPKGGTTTLDDQMKEFDNNLRRVITTQGMKLNSLSSQVADPTSHIAVQVDMIASKTGIPKRILLGSERGELSSGQDAVTWSGYVQARREESVEPQILRPFIQALIEVGVLPQPTQGYKVQWPSLFEVSDKDKAEVGRTRASALAEYTKNPLAQSLLPPQAFMEMFLGLSDTQIELVQQMVAESLTIPQVTEEEAAIEEELRRTE